MIIVFSWTSDGLASGSNITWATGFPKTDVADSEHGGVFFFSFSQTTVFLQYSRRVLGTTLRKWETCILATLSTPTRRRASSRATRRPAMRTDGRRSTLVRARRIHQVCRSPLVETVLGCSLAELSLDTKNSSADNDIFIPSTVSLIIFPHTYFAYCR